MLRLTLALATVGTAAAAAGQGCWDGVAVGVCDNGVSGAKCAPASCDGTWISAASPAAATCTGTATDTSATPDCAAAFAGASDALAASCPAGCTYTAQACNTATSCDDSAMATGVADGNAITAAAKAFSDATDVAAKKTAYTTAQGGVTLQTLAQGAGATGVAIDEYIISALDKTGIFADATCTDTTETCVDDPDVTGTATCTFTAGDSSTCGTGCIYTAPATGCAAAFGSAATTLAASCATGCTYTPAGPVAYDDGRQEAYKKGVFNQLMAHLCITTAQAAADGTDAAVNWNKAWAIYGYLGNAAASATLYATANKRCKNYDTCDATMTGAQAEGDATTNQNVETAFAGTANQANVDIIKNNIKITYISAALRYLNKMDKDLTGTVTEHREHQGEGHSFWRAAVAAGHAENTLIDSLYLNYAVAGLGGRYCEGKLALTTGLSAGDLTLLGTLNEAEGANLACHNTDATGRAAGLAITAAAQAFSAASGAAAKKTVYTTAQNGVTLQALAQGTGTADAGDDIDAYIISALDSTGIFADGAAVGYDDGREEAYKKGVFNQLMTHLAVTYAKEAACTDGAASAEIYSKAAAIYGNPFVDSASIGSTPQATANKRCKNYGTCSLDASLEGTSTQTSGLNYQANTNVAIMNAFNEATAANVVIIQEQIKVTYIQAALRYLNKMDKDLAADPMLEHREHQGEGHSFFLAAKAYLSTATATVVEALYTADYNSLTASVPLAADSKYCQGLGALSTQAAAADVGTLNEVPSDAVTCGCTYTGSHAQVTLAATGTCAVTQPTDTADVPCPVESAQQSGASVALTSALALAALVAMWL